MKNFTPDKFIEKLQHLIDYVKISDNDAEYEFLSLIPEFEKNFFRISLKFRRKK